MGVERFEVKLDLSPTGVYPPGATLQGNVVIENKHEIEFHEITVQIKGSACVSWFDFSRFKRRRGEEVYFNETISVLQSKDGSIEQAPGEHRYPFTFVLPENIPSSYKDYVSYNMKAVMSRTPGKVLCVSKIPFVVETVADLNEDENAKFPVRVRQRADTDDSMQFIGAEAWLDKAGYIPGETIRFNAKIENNRNESVRKTCAQLIQYTTLIDSKNRQNKTEKIIFEGEKEGISPNGESEWKRFPIVVPQLPPSRFEHCKLIDISYVVVLLIDPGLVYTNVVVPMNIVIGNVRVRKESPNLADCILNPLQSVTDKIRRLSRLSTSSGLSSIRKRKGKSCHKSMEPAGASTD